jgi:hypothetical protein
MSLLSMAWLAVPLDNAVSEQRLELDCDASCVYGKVSHAVNVRLKAGQLAQRLERRFHIPKVTGSNPVLPTIE